MRKLIMLCAAATMAMAAPVSAQAEPVQHPDNNGANAELLTFCTELIASGIYPTLNFGECMSYNNSSGDGFKTHFCDMLRETNQLADYGFSSYDDCVRNIEF